MRTEPALAAAWRTSSGGLARTVTFVNAPPPTGERTAVPLRVSSGFSKAVVSTSDGCVHSTGSYPSIVGDIVLDSGKWVYEIQVLEMDPTLSVPSASVGWADNRRFFGDYGRNIGVGDDEYSWGLGVQRSRGSIRHKAASRDFEDCAVRTDMTVGVAVDLDHSDGPRMLFGRDGVWSAAPADFCAGLRASGGSLMPAISCRSDCKLQLNFGARPFSHAVPEGFLPVHCQLTGDLPPAWLTAAAVASATPPPSASALAAASGAAGAGGAARTEVVALLMSQLRITGELLKMEAAKIGDEPLDEMVAKLERDMKGVVQRLGALAAPEGAPASGEGVPPP